MQSLAQANVLIYSLGGLGVEIGNQFSFFWNFQNVVLTINSH